MLKLTALGMFTEFSVLDTSKAGGTPFFWRRRTLAETMAPEVKSSEESSILTVAWRSLGLAETARLRRVTKRPAEGTGLLQKRKIRDKQILQQLLQKTMGRPNLYRQFKHLILKLLLQLELEFYLPSTIGSF